MQTDVKSASSSRQQVLEVDGCFQTMPTKAAAVGLEYDHKHSVLGIRI